MGELLRVWGLDRLFWGSDNLKGSLADRAAAWPLTTDDWEVVRQNRGVGFVPG
jgi:hypothetical protein